MLFSVAVFAVRVCRGFVVTRKPTKKLLCDERERERERTGNWNTFPQSEKRWHRPRASSLKSKVREDCSGHIFIGHASPAGLRSKFLRSREIRMFQFSINRYILDRIPRIPQREFPLRDYCFVTMKFIYTNAYRADATKYLHIIEFT